MSTFGADDHKKTDIAAKNLDRLNTRQADLFESRLALLCELCKYSFDSTEEDIPYFDRLRQAYSTATTAKNSESSDAYALNSFFSSVSVIEKLELCRELIKSYGSAISSDQLLIYADGSPISDKILPISRGRIAYMKNNFTESAFLKFSKAVLNPRSAYLQSFDSVCEEVYSGSCEFCILPIESSAEGRLNSFYSMIDRYELKIAAACTIEQHDSQRFTKFALLKKSLSDSSLRQIGNAKNILEFKVSSSLVDSGASPNASPIGDILLAANVSGMKLQSIDSMPLPYNEEMMAYYVSLSFDKTLPIEFLLYITLEFPQFDPLGVYFTVN